MISIKRKTKKIIKTKLKNIYFVKYLLIFALIASICERKSKEKNINKCYISPENSDKKIVHIVITKFMINFYSSDEFPKKIYTNEYIENGIKIMKKYLLPSLQHQSCRDFIWMLNVGDKVNISYLKTLLKYYKPFKSVILYNKDHKNFIRNITKNIDFLITTRIDYDNRIYWNAVNDVRKAVNISKPIFLYGYNKGFFYFEEFDAYIDYYKNYNNEGTTSIFQSLIIFMNKVNDSYTIYDMGEHTKVRKNLLNNYKKYGLEKLDYEPAIIEMDIPKFVLVKLRYFCVLKLFKKLKRKYFSLDKFYGIKE